MPRSTRTINQIRAIWPPRGKADSDFSVCRRNVSRASSLAEGRRSMVSRYSSGLLPRSSVTRMKRECDLGCREMLSDVNYGSQKRSKCCEIEGVMLTRYCQKFAVNLDFDHVTPSSRLRFSEMRQSNGVINAYIFMIFKCRYVLFIL